MDHISLRRISIYAGPPIDVAVTAVAGDENRSGRLNTICERYMLMVKDELSRLVLTRAEWGAILDANKTISSETTMVWANLHDQPELGEKWGIDHAALVRKLQGFPKSTLTSIIEACDRFWSRSDKPRDEALRESGIMPVG